MKSITCTTVNIYGSPRPSNSVGDRLTTLGRFTERTIAIEARHPLRKNRPLGSISRRNRYLFASSRLASKLRASSTEPADAFGGAPCRWFRVKSAEAINKANYSSKSALLHSQGAHNDLESPSGC